MEAQTIIFMRGPMGLIQDIGGGSELGNDSNLSYQLANCK